MIFATRSNIIEVNADVFYEHFSFHKEHNNIQHTERVLLRELEYYRKNCSYFIMTNDYSAGLALEKCGRIISVFSTQSTYRGCAKIMLQMAIEHGGNKLECNAVEQLKYIYSVNGFTPVAKAPLDKNDVYYEILESQNDESNQCTTIMYWVFDKKIARKIEESDKSFVVNFLNIKNFKNDKKAEKFRKKLVKQINKGKPKAIQYLESLIDF